MPQSERSDVVIIGGVAAGPKTGATLARRDPSVSITLFQKEAYISYGSCGLPYFASGDVNSFSDLTKTSYGVERNTDFFSKTKGFEVLPLHEVTAIDRKNKKVTVKDLSSGKTFDHGYGHLVIATGASPKKPPFPVAESPLIRYFTKPEDAINFRKTAQQGKVGSAAIIGAGYIGCELAESAGIWGIDAILVECEQHVLPGGMDPEMALIVQKELEKNNVKIFTGCRVKEITLNNERPEIRFEDREPRVVDYVFICTGVAPETRLAQDCGLKIGVTGAIEVDEHMRTSDPYIYAGGDCVELTHRITGKKVYIPLGSLANRHGRIIAENIIGKKSAFPGVVGTYLVKACDKNAGGAGLTEKKALEAGLQPESVWASFPDKPDYYPEAKEITVKIVYSKTDLKLIGIQAVGEGDICRRVDVFSAMLQHGGTVYDLLDFEHGYAPPYSEALDPLHHCAALALAQHNGLSLLRPVSDANYYRGLADDPDTIWLDIREADQFDETALPFGNVRNIINIPMNDVRSRSKELDPSKKYILICGRGVRSYQTWVILKNSGFKNIHAVGGGIAVL